MKTHLLFLVLALATMPVTKLVAAKPARPNILYFYVDDMGWGSIGPNGQAVRKAKNLPYVRTPNLDRLAKQGVNFTRGYACHVCSPSRSSQQSGFHQGHTFADDNDPNNARKAMRADDVLIGDALSTAGYVTGYWGKWGYGGSSDRVNPVIQNVQTLPTSHGYQHVLAELHHVRAHTFFQPTLWSAPAGPRAVGGLQLTPNSMAPYQNNTAYPNQPALQNHADYPKTAYCDDAYAFAALDFVRNQGQNYNLTNQPFFGLLAVQIPHAPFGEISELPDWDKVYAADPLFASLSDQTRQWAAMVTRIDAHFGNILAALEDPNNDGDKSDSIADNTLVIFQSDNGGPGGKNNVELDANGGLRGTKGKIQEGGIRIPLVMRWPARITADSSLKAGTDCDRVVDITDLLPTFCELAGTAAPLGIDGVSIAPTLVGSGYQRPRDFIIHEASNGESIIRGKYKLVRSKKSPYTLYDLESDHTEANDIATDHPQLVSELESLLLGERVAEPKGFANTYHRWTGVDGADTSDPDHWSDYKYTNAGITYMNDDGAPRLSWVASIENTSLESRTAQADTDLEFLGLEIRGNASRDANQTLDLGPSVNLIGRNEIRLAGGASLTVDNGTVSSLRWIDIQPGATLSGHGTINAIVYNNGSVAVDGGEDFALRLNSDYYQFPSAELSLTITGKMPAFKVADEAKLAGVLAVVNARGFKPKTGASYTVLIANQVTGEFSNPDSEVVASDGSRFTIGYSKSSVTLTAK
ncbi:Arylsulfatase [Novipirellula aureliae]|uniref:Arylsulfatase n=1 Tax=Novipirellula aureliae TaxID=2527966 RepID=A0A5C6EEJ2_9BACT|nr:sulfatase-like hydrolase/transferase [Novipirellula aureliae]TWU45649.1 Arylsulfatase [Novipirellula aureliae]